MTLTKPKAETPSVPIAILVSGRGSNLEAILDAADKKFITRGKVNVVISNRADAPALKIAKKYGAATAALEDQGIPQRSWDYDQKTIHSLRQHGVEPDTGLILLAGYMRILTDEFVRLFDGRILNIHPSLLPSFPGLNPQKQALEYGVKVTGCTVHFANTKVDGGPIILQTPVAVRDDDTVETLSERILREEHRIYPEAVRMFTEGLLKVKERRVLMSN